MSLLTLAFSNSASNPFKLALTEVLNALESRESAGFFAQFDGDGDNEVDFITFLSSSYASEHGGTDANGRPTAQRICK